MVVVGVRIDYFQLFLKYNMFAIFLQGGCRVRRRYFYHVGSICQMDQSEKRPPSVSAPRIADHDTAISIW
jgi:hypothetical protein